MASSKNLPKSAFRSRSCRCCSRADAGPPRDYIHIFWKLEGTGHLGSCVPRKSGLLSESSSLYWTGCPISGRGEILFGLRLAGLPDCSFPGTMKLYGPSPSIPGNCVGTSGRAVKHGPRSANRWLIQWAMRFDHRRSRSTTVCAGHTLLGRFRKESH